MKPYISRLPASATPRREDPATTLEGITSDECVMEELSDGILSGHWPADASVVEETQK